MSTIADRLLRIRQEIAAACVRSHRSPAEVTVVGVCKGQPAERIAEAIAAGITVLGENRLQEGLAHKQALPQVRVAWHFIGTLQTNKAARILAEFDLIESVGSLAALQAIDRRAPRPVEVFLEINCGGEASKSGFLPAQLPALLPVLAGLERVRITGLMTIPPPSPDSAGSRPYFRQLRSLQGTLNESGIPAIAIDQLSMGMSDDYPVAVEEGATLVRIGTALFGRRWP